MSWISGNGYQISCGTFVATDPADIDLGTISVWTGLKMTMAGATQLVGGRSAYAAIKVTVPGTTTVALNTSGDAWSTVTLTNASGSSATASGKILDVSGPRLTPNSVDGNQKVVTIQLSTDLTPN